MTISVGQSGIGANPLGAGPNSTGAVNTSATGSTFVILQAWYVGAGSSGATPVISDTINGVASGNTYSQIGTTLVGAFGGNTSAQIFECVNGNGGTNHVATSTYTGTGAVLTILVEILGGALTSILDQLSSPLWNDDVASPFTANAITPAQANELVLAFALTGTNSGTETLTWGNGFTQVEAEGDANLVTGAIAQLVINAIAPTNVSYTSAGAGTTECLTALVSFKAPAAAAPAVIAWVT